MVNPDSSFVQTWYGPHPQCYIPSPKAIGLSYGSWRFLTLYEHGGHFGPVSNIFFFYKFTPLNVWSLHMQFEFNWPSGFIDRTPI